jgi:hypothetical protein
MSANSLDIAHFPAILTMMAYRPSPTTIARWVAQPDFVQDTNLRPGEVYQMNRYGYLPDQGDMDIESRSRTDVELIGTANTRQIPNEKINIILRELTGPGSGNPLYPTQPGNFRFSVPALKKQQEIFWNMGYSNPWLEPQFHASVGSDTLLMDYRITMDRIYIKMLGNTPNKWNPSGIADGGTYASGPPKITVADLDYIHEWLVMNQTMPFDDGLYHLFVHPRFFNHLRQDSRYRDIVTSSAPYVVPVGAVMSLQSNPFGPGMMPPSNALAANNMIGSMIGMRDPLNQPNLYGIVPYLGQALPGLDNMGMPSGTVFNQFRIFISNNIPTKQVTLTYTASTDTSEATGSASRTAYPGMAFGRHALGELYGGSPESGIPVQIQPNENSDYRRFLIVIWQAFMGLQRLNDNFVIEARSYGRI